MPARIHSAGLSRTHGARVGGKGLAWFTWPAWFAWPALCTALAVAASAHALEVPKLRGHVNDYAGLLPTERAEALEAKLTAFEQQTQHQLALLTVKSLEGDALESFSIRVAEQWKLGGKERDDGLILLIVPDDRAMRIEVGYGLEGDIPDAIAARVIRDVLTPAFARGDFAGGIDAAFDVLMRAASGAPLQLPEPQKAPSGSVKSPRAIEALASVAIPLLFLLLASRGGRRRRGAWIASGMMGGMGGVGRGGFGGGFGGSGGFRGGGGGFGGGGASGRW